MSTAFKKTGLGFQMKEIGNMIRGSCVPFFQGPAGPKKGDAKTDIRREQQECIYIYIYLCVSAATYLDTGAVCSHVTIEGVCVFVCVSVCTCDHRCAILARTDRYLRKHSPAYMNLFTYTRAHTHMYIYIYICTCIYIYIQSKRYTGIGVFIHALRKAKVEVYFTDGSWVPAIVQHARGMHARSLLAAVLGFRGLGFRGLGFSLLQAKMES